MTSAKPAGVRTFLGFFPPSSVSARLAAVQRGAGENASHRGQRSLHVTLVFLGDLSRERRIDAHVITRRIAATYLPFTVTTKTVPGRFRATATKKSVVYAPLRKNAALMSLQRDLVHGLRSRAFALETRTYTPHLTIDKGAAASLTRGMRLPSLHWMVRAIDIVESQSVTGRHRYRIWKTIPLKQ